MCVVTLTWLVNNLNCCNPQHFGLGWSSSGCSPCVLRQKHVLGLFVSLSMLSPTHHAFLSLFHALCPSLLPLVCATGRVLLVKLVVPIVARPIDAFQLWQKNKCQTLACIHGDKLRVQNSHHAADGGRGLACGESERLNSLL